MQKRQIPSSSRCNSEIQFNNKNFVLSMFAVAINKSVATFTNV